MQQQFQQCKKSNSNNSVSRINKGIVYHPTNFGLKGRSGTGKGIKLCIVDTGTVKHRDLPKVNTRRVLDFTQKNSSPEDVHGHATGIAGLISSNNKNQIVGLSPDVNLYFAKILDNDGSGRYDSVISAVIWCIVQKIDIIVMSFGGNSDNKILRDVIKKAYNNNICMFASHGNDMRRSKLNKMFPASYPEVMSANVSNKISKTINTDKYNIMFPLRDIQTLYLSNKFIKMRGSSPYSAVLGGIGARIVQNMKGEYSDPARIYTKIGELYNK